MHRFKVFVFCFALVQVLIGRCAALPNSPPALHLNGTSQSEQAFTLNLTQTT